MSGNQRSVAHLRSRFDAIYDSCIVGSGFFESDEYYRNDRERYWRSLELLCRVIPPAPVTILEIGGGQLALLCRKLFGDACVVGDISDEYLSPIRNAGIEFVRFNLMETDAAQLDKRFNVVLLLEVIEHIPLPGYVVIERIKTLLDPGVQWQMKRAGMEIVMLEHDSLGRKGHSAKAKLARRLLAPLELRPVWRDGLVAAARKPDAV